jgi:pyruvate formate lyase activating enzyme
MEAEAKWLAQIDPEIPLHITRFFPRYLWKNIELTPTETLFRLEKTAKKYLKHVHIGNI